MKQVLMTVCAIAGIGVYAYDSAYDAIYTAAAGYVTLEADDSGNGDKSSFHTGLHWSDHEEPHPGTNYYVKTGKALYLDHVQSGGTPEGFHGDSIVVGGQVRMNGALGAKAICGPLTMLPDSVFHWETFGNVTGGSVHIKGTGTSTVKPVVFRSGTKNEKSVPSVNALMSFSSDADGELYWRFYDPDGTRDIGIAFTVQEDWSEFLGTFRIGRNFTFQTESGLYRMPGNLIVTTNAMLRLTAATGQSEIGALTIQTNGVLNLSAANGSQTVRISKKLELEPGALVIPQSFGGSRLPAQEFHPVFELTAEAVAAGLPDFTTIPVAICGRQPSIENGHGPVFTIFPELGWEVRNSEGGGKTVGFSYKETVSVTNSMNFSKTGFIKNGTGDADPAKYWSDGLYPQKGKGYYSSYNLFIRGADPYVFPGDSFMVNGAHVLLYGDAKDVTISNLVLVGNGKVRLTTSEREYHLRGTIKTLKMGASTSFRFMGGDKCTQFIDSDISGDGLLEFSMDTEVASSSWNKTLPVGTFELTGDNSAFSGKMMVDCWQTADSKYDAYFGGVPYVPGPYSNITLRVSSQANLGGALPETAYDALTVSNECRLALLSTAEFCEPTRGWFFPENAYLRVENGAVATVSSPITYGAKLVKEGPGTLVLGGASRVAPGVAVRPKLKVEEGSVGIVSPTAIGGLDVDFSAGTSLCLKAKPDKPEMAERGVDLTDASISSGSAISVELDMAGVDIEGGERVFVAICTVPSSQVSQYVGKFSFANSVSKYVLELTWVANPDSTSTLRAKVGKPAGFVLTVY